MLYFIKLYQYNTVASSALYSKGKVKLYRGRISILKNVKNAKFYSKNDAF